MEKSRNEQLLEALLAGEIPDMVPQSRTEALLLALCDKMANVSSGGGADLILFYLSGLALLCIDGMTWGEWIDSKYNTCGVYLEEGYVFDEHGDTIAKASTDNPVSAVATIIAGQHYLTL